MVALGTQGTWRRIHPAKSRWAAGTAWDATVQLPPGHADKKRSASPASQERHRKGFGATGMLLSSPYLARDLEISILSTKTSSSAGMLNQFQEKTDVRNPRTALGNKATAKNRHR